VALTHGSNRLDPSAELAGREIFGIATGGDGLAGVPGVRKAKERGLAQQKAGAR
jgi:hypothetical protein